MRLIKSTKFFSQLVKRKMLGRSLPLTAIFNVTNRCNTQCRHCYATYYLRNNSREMTTQQAKQLLSQLYENGCQRISFSGGEPLLRNDIGELITFVNSLKMSSVLNTNGLLVPFRLPELKKLDGLVISLDGRPPHHDIFREKGTGQKALAGIKTATEYGIRVYVNMVLNKYNLDDIDYMLDLARLYRFKVEFNLIISNIWGEGISPDGIKPSNEEIRLVLRHIIRRKGEGAPVLFSAHAYESVLKGWSDFTIESVMNAPPPKGMPECPAGRFFCLIDSDGTLWPCPHLMGKIPAKNALDVGITQAWKLASEHPCQGCYQVYHHEFSLLMNLHPKVIWNYFITSIQ